jgi:pimeloyl-ACP methyl ester carboxylesterase
VIVLGSLVASIRLTFMLSWIRLNGRDPGALRPFNEEEQERRKARKEAARQWKRQRRGASERAPADYENRATGPQEEFEPTEGGEDRLVCDVAYYARRVGLDVEAFRVQTEDGYIIALCHIFNPKEYSARSPEERDCLKSDILGNTRSSPSKEYANGNLKYPVLMVPGLLQTAGSFCTNDDDSLAFFLCKSGYDVWLGNNRCGFRPEHSTLAYSNPRMWAWNIRHMGVFDLSALISRVLFETSFDKLALICHSQGTAQTFVALARDQRPELGTKISVFCALAPAAYAGPLINKPYLKFMRLMSPGMFRVFFGIHSFIPLMMSIHSLVPGKLYGALGYRVFSYLFGWTDERWDRDLRSRMFQFSPVYISAEAIRWWLGRGGFATQKCILSTREQMEREDADDQQLVEGDDEAPGEWFDNQTPPFALWIPGKDDLVDGRRLLRRFESGREPHVQVVHTRMIEEYAHLDVLWAMDSIEKVGREVREVIWQTAPEAARAVCRTPILV